MNTVKRERSANFTLQERDLLISLIQNYQNILENKKSDASTWKKKEAAWKSIKNEFNTRSGGIFRSIKTLKIKYEGLKRTVRKKSAAIRSELCRTGGGENIAPPLDYGEEQIKAMISLSTTGSESIDYDSDISQAQGSQDGINLVAVEEESLDNEPEVIVNEATHNGDVQTTSLFDKLTQSRLELVELQKELLRVEIRKKMKECEFQEKERQWKEEEYKLKLQKLRKELNE